MAERPRPPEEWRSDAEARVASLAKPPGASRAMQMQPSCRSRVMCGVARQHRRAHYRRCRPSWGAAPLGDPWSHPHRRKRSARGPTTTRSWTSKLAQILFTTKDAAPAR